MFNKPDPKKIMIGSIEIIKKDNVSNMLFL